MSRFTSSTEVKREELEWGALAWFSSPVASNAANLVVLEVTLTPGGGHNFHRHPNQEEMIYVVEGEIEQWVEKEQRMLRSGDAAFIGPDVVHASFNISDKNAKLLAILGTCIGPEGYELIDVAAKEPWALAEARARVLLDIIERTGRSALYTGDNVFLDHYLQLDQDKDLLHLIIFDSQENTFFETRHDATS